MELLALINKLGLPLLGVVISFSYLLNAFLNLPTYSYWPFVITVMNYISNIRKYFLLY